MLGSVARRDSVQVAVVLVARCVEEVKQLKEKLFRDGGFDGMMVSKDGEIGESIMPGGLG